MDIHHPAGAAETVVCCAKVDFTDAKLAEERSAHDTGFDGDVEVAVFEDGGCVLEW